MLDGSTEYVFARSPRWAAMVGRERISGVAEIVYSEVFHFGQHGRSKEEIIRRVRSRIKEKYGSFWFLMLIRIAMILVEFYFRKRDERDGRD